MNSSAAPNLVERAAVAALNIVTNPIWAVFLVASVGQVIARYVLNVPLMWAEELARFALIWFCFLGAVQLVVLDDHIEIDFLPRRVGPSGKRLLWLLRQAVIIATGYMLIRGTSDLMALSMRATSPATGLPVWLWYAAGTAAGAGFIIVPALRLLACAASLFSTNRTGRT